MPSPMLFAVGVILEVLTALMAAMGAVLAQRLATLTAIVVVDANHDGPATLRALHRLTVPIIMSGTSPRRTETS